jgi:hypothetical protein
LFFVGANNFMALLVEPPGGAGARWSKRPAVLSRASVVARPAAVNAGLVAVLAPVIALRRLALAGPANEALAIVPCLAFKAVLAGSATGAAAVNARLVIVLHAVAVGGQRALSACADAVDAVERRLARLQVETRITLSAAINACLERRIRHVVFVLPARGRDAQERITSKSVGAVVILGALNAFALVAHARAGLRARRSVGQEHVLRSEIFACVERAFFAIVIIVLSVWQNDRSALPITIG